MLSKGDVRYCMNCMRMYLDALKRDTNNGAALASMRLLTEYVDDVMDEDSAMGGSDCAFSIASVDLQALLRKVFETTKAMGIGSEGIAISSEMRIVHNHVLCDVKTLRKVLSALACNVLISTSRTGNLHMAFSENPCNKEGCILLVARISYARNPEGSSSGLDDLRYLVSGLEGEVEQGNMPYSGAYVQVSIPLAVDYEFSSESKDEDKAFPFYGKRVLVAEDNRISAEILVQMLEALGLKADVAEDGSRCLSMVESHDANFYDAVLMDIRMPVMDGYEAATAIRGLEDERKSYIPIVAVTSDMLGGDISRAIDAGMNAFIGKPIGPDTLYDTLSRLIY